MYRLYGRSLLGVEHCHLVSKGRSDWQVTVLPGESRPDLNLVAERWFAAAHRRRLQAACRRKTGQVGVTVYLHRRGGSRLW